MMNQNNNRTLKTGGDPRALTDFASLREELSKLSHPARPDVDWQRVEQLALSLFEQNGVELQTAAWYTLARTQQAGLIGLNEGLSILDALISHQWGTCWPQAVHARIEILSSLSQRIQQMMRTLTLNYSDLSQLYEAEQLLTHLGTVLQRLELKHLSQLDTLRNLMHSSAVRLENSHEASGQAATTLTANPVKIVSEPVSAVKWIYVAQPEPEPERPEPPAPVKTWKPFAAGMATMLVVSAGAAWLWQTNHQPDVLQTQLAASLSPLPVVLTPVQREALRLTDTSSQDVMAQTQQQLTRLSQLSPVWNIDYSRQLLEQAQSLWPKQATPLAAQWQQQLHGAALPTESMNGWNDGMTKLQQLSDKLNGLDEKKGKYMTVSELKSVVFSTMQAFNRAIPAEEQLRVLEAASPGQPLPAAAQMQMEMHLRQLMASYAVVKENVVR